MALIMVPMRTQAEQDANRHQRQDGGDEMKPLAGTRTHTTNARVYTIPSEHQ